MSSKQIRKKSSLAKSKNSASVCLTQILNLAAAADDITYHRIVRDFRGLMAEILLEDSDEHFYVKGDKAKINVIGSKPEGRVNITVTLSYPVVANVLRGVETPVEAFFLGHLRARGTTIDLYQLHKMFIMMAEIGARSPDMLAAIEEFIGSVSDK